MTFEDFRAAFQADLLAVMPEQVARLGWSAPQIASHQRAGLRALLAHAVEHSPFHRRRLAGVDVERIELADLRTLPVMTKGEMMRHLGDVFTDRRLTPGLIERTLASTTSEPVVMLDRYIALTSGGSSGQRGVFVLDREALVQFVGALTRSLMARLLATGGPPPGGLRIAMIAAACAVHATGTAPPLTAGAHMPFRFFPIPVTLALPEIVERLNALQPMALSGTRRCWRAWQRSGAPAAFTSRPRLSRRRARPCCRHSARRSRTDSACRWWTCSDRRRAWWGRAGRMIRY
jgi:hypothetical protein